MAEKTQTMTGDEFMAMCHEALGLPLEAHEMSGKGRHGWKVQLSKRIGMSTTWIAAARTKGPSSAMISAVDALMTGVKELGVEEDLPLQAGSWFVGEPADRKRDSATLGEVVVTHMSVPRFVLHAEWRRGDYTEDGLKRLPAETTFRVQWIDQPSSRARKLKLLDQAKRRASDRLYESAMAAAEQQGRGKLVSAARTACGLSAGDMAAMSEAGLQIAKYGSDAEGLTRAYEEVDRQRMDLHTRRGGMSQSERRAFDLGRTAGMLEQQQKIYFEAWVHEGAVTCQLVASKPYKLLPLAHLETDRGRTDEELEAERDFAEMAALDWGDDD